MAAWLWPHDTWCAMTPKLLKRGMTISRSSLGFLRCPGNDTIRGAAENLACVLLPHTTSWPDTVTAMLHREAADTCTTTSSLSLPIHCIMYHAPHTLATGWYPATAMHCTALLQPRTRGSS